MNFAERFRYLLECAEMDQKDMAPILRLSASTISNYAQGYREPDFDTLVRIADYFGVSVDYLLGREYSGEAAGQEEELLRIFRQFDPEQRAFLLEQAKLLRNYRPGRHKRQ